MCWPCEFVHNHWQARARQLLTSRENLLIRTTLLFYSLSYGVATMEKKRSLTAKQILSLLQKNRDTLRKYSVKRIGLFGSYAAGEQTMKSDIDFIVVLEKPSWDNFYGLCNYLEKLFQKKVDVLTPEGIKAIRIKEVAESIKKSVIYV